jgi:CheY-like chemotaxis protein
MTNGRAQKSRHVADIVAAKKLSCGKMKRPATFPVLILAGKKAVMNFAMTDQQPDSAPSLPGPILIVDDSEPTARGLGYLFRDAGYQAATFSQGLAALEYARDHKPAGAVIDIHLPDISGLILSRRLRDILGPQPPIIVVSGDASMEVLNSLPHVGATYFFRKPVSGATLIDHFREFLSDAEG